MKTFFKKFLLATLGFALLIFTICFVFSSLCKSGIMSSDVASLVLQIVGILLFFSYAFLLGLFAKQKGWLIGLVLAVVYGVIAYSVAGSKETLTLLSGIMIGLKVVALFTGAVIGVNLSHQKA